MKEFFFDLELQELPSATGGWDHLEECKMSVAVAFAFDGSELRIYTPADLRALRQLMRRARRVIGYNIVAFDRLVLASDGIELPEDRCVDLMQLVAAELGFRVPLSGLAEATLRLGRTQDGLANVKHWKEHRVDRIIENCCNDVILLRRLWCYAREHGCLYVKAGPNRRRRRVALRLPTIPSAD